MNNYLLDAARTGRDFVKNVVKLQQADSAKFSRDDMSRIVKDNILLGRLNVCEALLKTHKENPYTTVDELIGDLQIILAGDYNGIERAAPTGHKLSVEQLID